MKRVDNRIIDDYNDGADLSPGDCLKMLSHISEFVSAIHASVKQVDDGFKVSRRKAVKSDADVLRDWLVDHCAHYDACVISKRHALMVGPVRQKDRFHAAINELVSRRIIDISITLIRIL